MRLKYEQLHQKSNDLDFASCKHSDQPGPPMGLIRQSAATIMIQSFQTDRSGQTVQIQIRLLLEEQSDQSLHCLLFPLNLFDVIPRGKASFLEF